MPKILYDGIKRTYADDSGQGLRLDQLAGLDVEQGVQAARAASPLSTPMPRPVHARRLQARSRSEGRAELVKQLAKDAWVWGDRRPRRSPAPARWSSGVIDLYEQDYIRAWDALLDDLQFVSVPHRSPQTNEALRDPDGADLAAARPPARGRRPHHAGRARRRPQAAASVRSTRRRQKCSTSMLKPVQTRAGMPTVAPGTLVTAHFQWVRQLTAGEAGQDPARRRSCRRSREIQQQLDTLGPDVAGGSPSQILAEPVVPRR